MPQMAPMAWLSLFIILTILMPLTSWTAYTWPWPANIMSIMGQCSVQLQS